MASLTWPEGYIPLSRKTEEVYSDAFIDDVMREFSIPADMRRAFINAIDISTRDYLQHRNRAERDLPVRERRARLDRLRKALEQVETAFDELAVPDQLALQNIHWDFMFEHGADGTDSELARIGAAVPNTTEERDGWLFLNFEAFPIHLSYQRLAVERVKTSIGPGRSGPRTNTAMEKWVYGLCCFWRDGLGRKITFHQTDGIPQGDTWHFLWRILEPLAPDQMTALKTELAKERQHYAEPRETGSLTRQVILHGRS